MQFVHFCVALATCVCNSRAMSVLQQPARSPVLAAPARCATARRAAVGTAPALRGSPFLGIIPAALRCPSAASVSSWPRGGRLQCRAMAPPVQPLEQIYSKTAGKALGINLDPKNYGVFAEIGAGQEVARWFFR